MNLIKVVPPSVETGQPCRTQGTKVLLSDGTKVDGVTKIELVCELNDVWRGVIYVNPEVLAIDGVDAVVKLCSGTRGSQMDRIESKLDALIAALAEDEEAAGSVTLDEPDGAAPTFMHGLDG